MEKFLNRTFSSLDGDVLVASYDGISLKISIPSFIQGVELNFVISDGWYEKGNIRIKLDEDALYIFEKTKGLSGKYKLNKE